MLHFTFSTVLMALLTSNILASLIAVLFLHGKTMARLGYKVLAFFVALTVIRLLIPYEFPFSTNIYLPYLLSQIVSYFREPQIQVLSIRLSFWNLFEIIWAIGIIIHLVLYIHDYRHTKNYILKYGQDKTGEPKHQEILDKICSQLGKRNCFRVVELPNLAFPILFGHREPAIILPDHLALSSDQLYYVLSHEALHYFHRDFLIKGAVRILSIIYWWNPACILLYQQTNTLLEMNIDDRITQKSPDITVRYAECLLYIKKNAVLYSPRTPRFIKRNGCFFVQSKETDLKRRITMLLQDSGNWRKRCIGILLTLSMAGVCLFSYFFILEAEYYSPQMEEAFIVPTPDNTYFIQIDAENYEVYMNDSYIGTETSLEYYPKGIKIYNQEGDLIDET
ncbi:MAG: M56 family metallopeptidase [Lachnospiraceae bacterium]|nr:M56 family metallopeptidase [Lachnospiraceae bacterium]